MVQLTLPNVSTHSSPPPAYEGVARVCTCDLCGNRRPGVEHTLRGTPVAFTCFRCERPKQKEVQ